MMLVTQSRTVARCSKPSLEDQLTFETTMSLKGSRRDDEFATPLEEDSDDRVFDGRALQR